jgi:exopolyphosphatase / guanosine-5'-triphosphate,3'-diphosphate pyrophosphatase
MSSALVPRWEWRTFGDEFGNAEKTFAASVPERVQESDELYLLSLGEGDTVKVRDELMDVKHLEHVNNDGLEQWLPVMKAAFPLSAADMHTVLSALGVEAAPLARDEYTLSQLLEEIVRPTPALLAVEVHKRRQRYTIGGCMSELTVVRTSRGSIRTIAIEAEDAGRVIAVVRDLGLDAWPNTSFPRGLKSLVGFRTGRFSVVDVGTNSVKFHIAERDSDGSWSTLVDRAELTRLGEGLDDTGELQPEPLARTIDAIATMAEEARREGVVEIAAVGTAGLRIASNASAFVEAVRARCGVEVEVIPGEEEARLAYLAAVSGLGPVTGRLVVFDTGGGSSQFTFGHGATVDERFSVDVGAVRFTERFNLASPVSEEAVASALVAIAADLGRLDGRERPDALVGLGGSVTNLAAVKQRLTTYDRDLVQGTELDRAEVDRQIELYRVRSADERRQIPGLQPGRAEVILAGACIVGTVMSKLGMPSLTVSDRGLRHGVLAARFGQA